MAAMHVDEALAHGAASEDNSIAMDSMRSLHHATVQDVPFHCVQLDDVFDGANTAEDKGSFLVALLQVQPGTQAWDCLHQCKAISANFLNKGAYKRMKAHFTDVLLDGRQWRM